MQTLVLLVASSILVMLYVGANFWIACWLLNIDWKSIRRHYKANQRKTARFLASPRILNLSAMIAIFLIYGFYQLNTATTIWSFSLILLCLGLLPILASFFVLDKILTLIEPKSTLIKWSITLIFGLFAWFIKAAISDELNEIFPFDPSAMPVALSAGIFLAMTGFAAVLSSLFMVIIEPLIIFGFFDRIERKKNPLRNFVIATLPFSFFLGFYASGLAFQRIGLSPLRTLLISRIAFEYDFNSNYLCHKIENGIDVSLNKEEKVLFIGSTQKLGIAATANKLPQKAFSKIQNSEIKKLHPFGFHPVVCNNP